jgi:hypothetical protein
MKKRIRKRQQTIPPIVAGVDTADENSSYGISVLLSGKIETMNSVQLYLFT